jgi:hypothetical protein
MPAKALEPLNVSEVLDGFQPPELACPALPMLKRGIRIPGTFASYGHGQRPADDGSCIMALWLVEPPGNQMAEAVIELKNHPQWEDGYYVNRQISGREVRGLIGVYSLAMDDRLPLDDAYIQRLR